MTPEPTRHPSTEIAEFVADLSFADLDSDIRRLAERCFVDTVGVTLAGTESPAGRKTRALVCEESDGGDARLLGVDARVPATAAAFANGTAAHALDFDDVSWGMDGHPSVTLVVPILAAASGRELTGQEALTAYVAGFETACYVAAPISPAHYERGWHATATFGVFGAAAAAAKVSRLSPDEIRNAVNIAASTPAGLKRNFGSMTKPMHAGQAARSGLTAARLAERGFTANREAIGGAGGFLGMYGEPDPSAFPVLGQRWALQEDGVHVKKYPCCYYSHTTIASVVDMVREHDLAPSDVASIHVHFSGGARDALVHDDPDTPLEAKFSLPYLAAYAAVNRGVGLEAFEKSGLADEAVRSLQDRVTYTVDPTLAYDEHTATVVVERASGADVERTLEDPPGTHQRPLSEAELRDKFLMCARRVLTAERADRVVDRLDALRDVPDVAELRL